MSYVKGKTTFRDFISVNDFGLEKLNDMVRISVVFDTTLGRRLRAVCCE